MNDCIKIHPEQHIADYVTFSRIVISLVLLFLAPFSLPFMLFYLLAGISDMLDGHIARKLKTESAFGTKLDTLADFVFWIICCIKLFRFFILPIWPAVFILIIAMIKITSVIIHFVKHKSLIVSVHSVFNKITGILLFITPICLQFHIEFYIIIAASISAFISAIDELIITITSSISQ